MQHDEPLAADNPVTIFSLDRKLNDLLGQTLRGQAMSTTRPYVDAFADAMEAKLAENRHKGDRDGWKRVPLARLKRMLLGEVAELFEEIDLKGVPTDNSSAERKHRIRREAADVANIAMMIADVAGGMKPAHAPEPDARTPSAPWKKS